jgi:membrane protease YdiL (CAAX protease family)
MISRRRDALVWLLLIVLPGLWIWLSTHEAETPSGGGQAEHADTERLSPLVVLQGRVLVMTEGLSGHAESLADPDPLGTRPMARLGAAMLLARIGEKDRAMQQVRRAADEGLEATDPELVEAVRKVVVAWPPNGSLASGGLDAADWAMLQGRMGWFGTLARSELQGDPVATKAVEGAAFNLLLTLTAAGIWFLGAGLAGVAVLIVVAVMGGRHRLRSGLEEAPRLGTLLGETFVAWMALLMAMNLVAGVLVHDASDLVRSWLSMSISLASLAALAWPVVRGRVWSQVRRAMGLHLRGGAWRMAWMSGVAYVTALPCMAVGILAGQGLAWLLPQRDFRDVSHPVQELLPTAGGATVVSLFVLACVVAPIVEETLFRGVLYGHVRDRTRAWVPWGSMAFAALCSAAVFAAIHPQGVLAVPALAGLSIGFCISREWSGSVVPGMLAHGFHNGLLLAINLVLSTGA